MATSDVRVAQPPEPVREQVRYCTACVVSNQRPRITFDENGVCSACSYSARKKNEIDWEKRHAELIELLDKHRRDDGTYDVIVPCSGGKDSSSIAHQLKHEYGMHPLTVTWAPNMWTDIGWQNLKAFVDSGFDNVLGMPAGDVNRRLARRALEEMGDPFLPFIYGVKAFPIRMAIQHGVKLVMYAEDGEVEYGGETKNADKPSIDLAEDMVRQYFSGHQPEKWLDHGFTMKELQPYRLPPIEEMVGANLDYQYFAYYKKWIPQENYYYAAEHCGFRANPSRSEGTYSKYASLDDKLDGLHYYLMFIKFGIGRATSDAAHEIRDGHLTRDEGVGLVRKYDGEFPSRHFEDCLEYLGLSRDRFTEIIDSFRSPHIWRKEGDEWILRSQVA